MSGKNGFVAGADIDMLTQVRFAQDAERRPASSRAACSASPSIAKPVIAAIHGAALGGGFELALACHALVLTCDPTTVVGLPEVELGLLPAANGLFRIAESAGLAVALDLGLSGKHLRADEGPVARPRRRGVPTDHPPRRGARAGQERRADGAAPRRTSCPR